MRGVNHVDYFVHVRCKVGKTANRVLQLLTEAH